MNVKSLNDIANSLNNMQSIIIRIVHGLYFYSARPF
jgi:hypothetical protein